MYESSQHVYSKFEQLLVDRWKRCLVFDREAYDGELAANGPSQSVLFVVLRGPDVALLFTFPHSLSY